MPAKPMGYTEMMRAVTNAAIWRDRLEQHSEMLKPYKSPGYQEMEHYYPDFNWNFDWDFNIDLGFPGADSVHIQDAALKTDETCSEFDCWLYRQMIIWDCDDKQVKHAQALDEFADISVEGPIALYSWNKKRFVLTEATVEGGNYGIRGEKGIVHITFTPPSATYPCKCDMLVTVPNDCQECVCDDADAVSFDEDSTPDTITKGSYISVYIQDGCPPYTWSVSGLGYTLGESVTEGNVNLLSCADGTCDSDYGPLATLTVTDACGYSDTLVVRNSYGGEWANIDSCINSCLGTTDLIDPAEEVNGGCKWIVLCYSIGSSCPECSSDGGFGCPASSIDPSLYCGGSYPCCGIIRYQVWVCS